MPTIYNYLLKSKDVDEYGQHDYKPLSSFNALEIGSIIEWGQDKKGNLREWTVFEEM